MSARGDFLNYALSLMRSHNDEHSDVLPVLDVCSLKHVAYVFQALIYWIKAMNQQTTLDTPQMDRKRSVDQWFFCFNLRKFFNLDLWYILCLLQLPEVFFSNVFFESIYIFRNRDILELGLDNEDSEHENDEDTNQSKLESVINVYYPVGHRDMQADVWLFPAVLQVQPCRTRTRTLFLPKRVRTIRSSGVLIPWPSWAASRPTLLTFPCLKPSRWRTSPTSCRSAWTQILSVFYFLWLSFPL